MGDGGERLQRPEPDLLLPERFDFGQPGGTVVGNLEALSDGGAQNAPQVIRRLPAQHRLAAAHFLNEEPPPGHVQ